MLTATCSLKHEALSLGARICWCCIRSASPLILFFSFPTLIKTQQTAIANTVPLRATVVSSPDQIESVDEFFDDPSPPAVRREDGLGHVRVSPPVETLRRGCNGKGCSRQDGLDRVQDFPPAEFRRRGCNGKGCSRQEDSESINSHPNLIPPKSVATTPAPPAGDGGTHTKPLPPIPMGNLNVRPVHERLQKASGFVERSSYALMLLEPWESVAVLALILGKQTSRQRTFLSFAGS